MSQEPSAAQGRSSAANIANDILRRLNRKITRSPGLISVARNIVPLLARHSGGHLVLGTSMFLRGMIVAGSDPSSAGGNRNSSHWLFDWLKKAHPAELSGFLHDYRSEQEEYLQDVIQRHASHGAIMISDALDFRISMAVQIASDTVGRASADLRHVLAGILNGPMKGEFGPTLESPFLDFVASAEFRKVFFSEIAAQREPDEDMKAWSEHLRISSPPLSSEAAYGEASQDLTASFSSAVAVEPAPAETNAGSVRPIEGQRNFIAQMWNDTSDAGNNDFLDIGHEVTAFAQLIAGKKTVPPLAIGVFGEWGSGKTYFMDSVFASVEKLSRSRDEAAARIFHGGVVQIRFNAWHYIETNLWASLVEHIFRELDGWLRKSKVDSEQLFEQLTTARQLRYESARSLIENLVRENTAKSKVDEALKQRDEALKAQSHLSAVPLWKAAIAEFEKRLQGEDYKELEKFKNELGFDAAARDLDSLGKLIEDTGKQSERARFLWRSVANQLSRGKLAWALAATILLAPVLVLAFRFVIDNRFHYALSDVSAVLLGFASMLSSVVVIGRTLLNRGMRALKMLDGFKTRLDAAIDKATEAERKAALEAEKELHAAQAGVVEAERQFREVSARAKQAEEDFQNESAQGRLNRFIRERVSDGVYAKHLSLVATVRKDFSQLSEIMVDDRSDNGESKELQQMREQYREKVDRLIKDHENLVSAEIRTELLSDVSTSALRHFSRIVLYIDDLDRCPPKKVSEVIQAIHLLLFFRLFIVVVAVDARWMARSLETEFPDLLAKSSGQGAGLSVPATAQDYIEKIFQIPFWVQPMTDETSRAFVKGLASTLEERDAVEPPPAPAPPVPDVPADGAGPPVPSGTGADETLHRDPAADVVPASPVETLQPAPAPAVQFTNMTFSRQEVRIMERFAPLTSTSPRRAKRILNVYQLLKTGLCLAAADGRISWSALCCPVILTMLAFVDGERRAEESFFQALLDPTRQFESVSKLRTSIQTEIGNEGGTAHAKALDRLISVLKEESFPDDGTVVALMRTLAPIVRRYSFDCRL